MSAVKASEPAEETGFEVHLENFTGPFDLLLSLIARRQLDVTQLALSQVTDEFLTYLKKISDYNLASEFLVVAASLLDLKAARLLPNEVVEDPETLASLEAADLLFARLLRYRAYKQLSQYLAERYEEYRTVLPREVMPPEELTRGLAPLRLRLPKERLLEAYLDLRDREPETVSIDHVHQPLVAVATQVRQLHRRLLAGPCTFEDFIGKDSNVQTVIASFLAVLTMYRDGVLDVQQAGAGESIYLELTGKPMPIIDDQEMELN
ncbi:hypothetical protein BSR29_04715 [Boudabousia liubingyangii]|uniref:Segregation and condensation protein A n=1 Tax=Boudabousia liubingyangii TaxID=1921764 RepID=A0A1Q5PNP7_9ACTO|nr:ScpA family protein [Boudabousia liubingyangii]OKL47711.1 hypothetical protein BSR28_04280 [Boudabousia liubingyangii]OKL49137.1 hypothetical protein BSR29_04715 [Boudabousia liubingyangii]